MVDGCAVCSRFAGVYEIKGGRWTDLGGSTNDGWRYGVCGLLGDTQVEREQC